MVAVPPKTQPKLHHLLTTLHRHAKKSKTIHTQKQIKKLKSAQEKAALSESSDIPIHVRESRVKLVPKCERGLEALKRVDLYRVVFDAVLRELKRTVGGEVDMLSELERLCLDEYKLLVSKSKNGSADSEGVDIAVDGDEGLKRVSGLIVETKSFAEALESGVREIVKLAQGGAINKGEVNGDSMNKKRKLNGELENGENSVGKYVKSDAGQKASSLFTAFPANNWLKAAVTVSDKTQKFDSKLTKPTPSKIMQKNLAETSNNISSAFVDSLNDSDSNMSLSDFDGDISDVDSLGLDDEAKNKVKAAKEIKKKNRMGQRARRELWERQYGKEANHMKLKLKDKREKQDLSDLHPSWAAKKSQKQTGAVTFEGHKIKFGEGATESVSSSSRHASSIKEENLHPSWAAKKAKKASGVVAFQGKKVVFDDESNRKSIAPQQDAHQNLHPSWAAKKSQNAKIGNGEFTGSRLKFSE